MEVLTQLNKGTFFRAAGRKNCLCGEQRYAAGKRQRPLVLRVTAAANSGYYGRCYALRADMVVQVQLQYVRLPEGSVGLTKGSV